MFHYDPNKTILIAGFGNPLLGDDGAGIEAVRKLSKLHLPENVVLQDCGTMGIDVIPLLEQYSQVIIIDCIKTKGVESDFIEFCLDEVNISKNENPISVHNINLNDALTLMNALKIKIPNILIYGILPNKTDLNIGISDKTMNSVNLITNKISTLLSQN
ncbi:MAG: hydrogenase maturation protease [Spirochaetota bacterium]|nr:hydrogenase maturation protease [Spirochaetota bacterium]